MFLPVLMFALLPPAEEEWQTITVTAEPAQGRVLPPQVEIGETRLLERQPRNAAEALEGLAGVSTRTNSRGETIARVRGSEERQTQVFLDGAPLAVPWDGRVDLGVIPAGLIGAVSVTKGAVPIEYGANAVAGAVDLRTRSGGERNFRALAELGSYGFGQGSVVATLPVGGLDLTLAAWGVTRDAEPVADLDALPFSQPRSNRRLNTDLDSVTLFAAARYRTEQLTIRGYLLHVDAERGIAPESDRDPAVDAPRYWRYPRIEQTQAALTTDLDLGGASARLVLWRQWFGQRIEQYTNARYAAVRATQEDEDDTHGGRLVLSASPGPVTLRLVGTAQTSRHAQVDTTLPRAPGPRLVFRQNLYTLGGEADAPLFGGNATLGLAYDRSTNTRTGDKPGQPAKNALALSAAYRLTVADGVTLALSGGRRSRFPSARELFGEALGRFLPNADLAPERSWLADAELSIVRPRFSLTLNPFFIRSTDTIAQRVMRVNGVNRRQRFNLSGSRSYGVDAAVTAQVSEGLDWELNASLLRARADAGAAPFRQLVQRPSYDAMTALDWQPVERLSLRGEYRRVGPAVDLAPNGIKARLKAGEEINLRGRWNLVSLFAGAPLWLTASIDNVTDDVITPQLGLPLPGRSFRIGFQIG
ncbi:TonB-dependent receptor plug domain-containing protein [Sphingomonas sp.]|jgi:iron complex outermembrane receptor protein|uniref:TonB-dependent receptor plug domain-containing protein n=1 Tax=Sphingomonas sp. TaxID=28214 RepID=UPI002DE62BAE|nr:TonB-dependent receptor [Sphingomonas sp.]